MNKFVLALFLLSKWGTPTVDVFVGRCQERLSELDPQMPAMVAYERCHCVGEYMSRVYDFGEFVRYTPAIYDHEEDVLELCRKSFPY